MKKDCRSNFKWCIDNDFQVYVKPMNHSKNFKIAIRKGCLLYTSPSPRD